MNPKSSALRPILDKVFVAKDRDSALQIVTDHLTAESCPIRASERHIMLTQARQCPTLLSLQKYMTNSFLRFEGMRIR